MADIDLSTQGSVIKTAYDAQPNTNPFTDGEKAKVGNYIDLKSDYGALGDGLTDDYAAINAAFGDLSDNDILYVPAGIYITSQTLVLPQLDNIKIFGQHNAATQIKLAASSDINLFQPTECDFLHLGDIHLNGGFSDTGFSNHALSGVDCNNLETFNLRVSNYKNSGALIYKDSGTADECVHHNIYVDGNAVANNGVLFVDSARSRYEGGVVKGCPGSPGYAFQFKGDCQNSSGVGMVAENCTSAFALGQETQNGADNIYMQGSAKGCGNAVIAGYATRCRFDVMAESCTNVPVRLETDSDFIYVSCVSYNSPTAANVARIWGDNNVVDLKIVEDGNTDTVKFESDAQNNLVIVDVIDRASMPSTAADMVNDDSGNSTNKVQWTYGDSRYN